VHIHKGFGQAKLTTNSADGFIGLLIQRWSSIPLLLTAPNIRQPSETMSPMAGLKHNKTIKKTVKLTENKEYVQNNKNKAASCNI